MPRKKTALEFFRRGKEKGSEQCTEGINDSTVNKKLQDKTLSAYQRMIGLWNHYVEEHRDDHPSPYDLKSLKDFVKEVAFGIDGVEDDPDPAEGTVMVYWKQFMAGWRRENDAIPGNTTLSVTNFIKYELPEILRRVSNIRMVKNKRQRRFGTRNHFVHLGRQLWANDWVVCEKPATRVYDWADFMSIVCSSARIGEYIESSCRPGSGRGMYYRDLTFGVFLNEHGNAEFAIQLVRDAKGMTDTPDKRPEHSLYEGLGPMPLICNPMLPILAILIASKAFRDYDTIEELLAVEPSEGEMVHLQWKEDVRDLPFFKSMSARSTPGKIETAGAFGKRLRALGFRAGYLRPPTIHDFRAEGLYWINKLYTLAQRMKHAGQKDPKTYDNHYAPNNSGTDGQASYFGLELRTIANDLFRGLTLARNPQLSQSLPAEKQEELENSPEFVAIKEELAALRGRGQDPDSVSRRRKLYAARRRLAEKALRKWQKAQPYQSGTSGNDPPCYHRSIFSRVRFLMPERDRLASTILETATLRSPTGLSALRDMVALCEKDAEVEFRPGLEPEKCCCSTSALRRKLVKSTRGDVDTQSTYDWRHIYNCYKKSCSDFAEFCSLPKCNKWIFGKAQWSDHCRAHLDRPESLPVQCDPLIYGGVLAAAGYCIFCMADPSLPPEERLRPFLDAGPWKGHVHDHYKKYVQTIDDRKPVKCPDAGMRCVSAFDSAKHLRFHLLDVHCPDFTKEPNMLEMPKDEDDVKTPRLKMRRRNGKKGSNMEVGTEAKYDFVDETAETARRHPSASVPSPPSNRSVSPLSGSHRWALDIEPSPREYTELSAPMFSRSSSPGISEGGCIWDRYGGSSSNSTQSSSLPDEPPVTADPDQGDGYEKPVDDEGLDEFSSLWDTPDPILRRADTDDPVYAGPLSEAAIRAQTPTITGRLLAPGPTTDQGMDPPPPYTEVATNSNPPSIQRQPPPCIFCKKAFAQMRTMWECMDGHLRRRDSTGVPCPSCREVCANEREFRDHAFRIHNIPRKPVIILKNSGKHGVKGQEHLVD